MATVLAAPRLRSEKALDNVTPHRNAAWSPLFLIAVLVSVSWSCEADDPGQPRRPTRGGHVADGARLIGAQSTERMDALLDAVLRDADVEIIAVSTPTLGGRPIADYANRLFDDWKVGDRSRGNRGLLLVVAESERRVRLEVSYGLEGILTDAFVSYVEHEQMVPYFERGRLGEGIEATVELVAGRVYERILGRSYDPRQPAPADIGGYRSGGAGAETKVPLDAAEEPAQEPPAADPLRARFAAQPTPAAAWERFLELNSRRIKATDLGIYDERARAIVGRTNSNAGQDHIARLYADEPYTVRFEGDRAAIVFLDDPNHLLAPWFFHRGAEGWQLDGSMYPGIVGYNHRNQWFFRRRDHAYMFAFKDFSFDRHGFGYPRRE